MPSAFTPEAVEARRAIIRQHYPTGDLPTLAKQLGVSLHRLQTLASRLGVHRSAETISSMRRGKSRIPARGAEIREKLAELAKRPNGVSSGEVAAELDVPTSTVWGAVSSMQRAGKLYPATISHRRVRYFSTADAAADFLRRLGAAGRRPAASRAPTVVVPRGPGPAYLPGEPKTTPSTKYTIAPAPKASLRSNTYLLSA